MGKIKKKESKTYFSGQANWMNARQRIISPDKTEKVPEPMTDEERAILREAAKKLTALETKGHELGYGETPESRRREIVERNAG